MSGDIINLTYYENTDLLQSAIVTGEHVACASQARRTRPERVLHADNIEIGMAPDGTTLTSLNGAGSRRARSAGRQRSSRRRK